MEYLERPDIKEIFHPSVKFVWGQKPIKWNDDADRDLDKEEYWLYALNTEGRKEAPLAGITPIDDNKGTFWLELSKLTKYFESVDLGVPPFRAPVNNDDFDNLPGFDDETESIPGSIPDSDGIPDVPNDPDL